MDSERIVDEVGAAQGWNDSSKLALALEYIENQQDNAAWEDFLRRKASEENAL